MMARHGVSGPRVALEWPQLLALQTKARALMRRHPARAFGDGERTRQLRALAREHHIDLRTLYRYLRYREPMTVRVGPWTAKFARVDRGEGAPVQVSSWVHDDEAEGAA